SRIAVPDLTVPRLFSIHFPYHHYDMSGKKIAEFIWCVNNNYLNSNQIIRRLEKDGWYLDRVKGSHHRFKHKEKSGLVQSNTRS
ncbi:MAG: type II toxin-antitoxin system HicA family toxin, partial [Candidatus Accumulibacter sp.]|nr:type II toxin-antitoxin system HicA family toxin [Accumulibacter sp.]